jgi:hypothetical protein
VVLAVPLARPESDGRAVDGEHHEEEEVACDLGSPALVAGALSCKRGLADEEATTVRILGTDVNRERWLMVAPMSRGDGRGESEQSGERVRGGGEKVDGFLPGCPRVKDKAGAERTEAIGG